MEGNKGGVFGCVEWSWSGVTAQAERNHPKALLFALCTDLIKLLGKTNPCDRCPLQGEIQSPTGGEQR